MRVALLVEGRRIRGNERQALLLVEGLVQRGHDVFASCRSRGPVREALRDAGARTSGTRPRGDADLVSALLFAGWLRRRNLDAILVLSWKRAAIAGWTARLAGVPRVVLRLGGERDAGKGLGAWIRRLALQRWYHAAAVNSESVREALMEAGMPGDRVRVIANGTRIPPAPAAPLHVELGLPVDALLLATVGGLEHNKGADLLPAILAAQGPDVHLVVAGAGSPVQRDALLTAARELGVGDRFHLLGHREDVPAVLAAADAFLMPSRSDSLPNAMLEAMASALPVIMAEVGGVRWALGAGGGRPAAGWVADPEDVEGLAAAVREVMADLRTGGAEALERGAEAAWRALHWFGPERMTREYEDLLVDRSAGDA